MAMPCTSPTEIANGHVTFDSLSNGPTWADTADVKYKCFKYYGLVDSNTLTCSSGSWSGTIPKCEYHQKTEIVFWLVIALVILLLLLLLALIIFLCCYFCRCCKRTANRKRKSSESNKKQSDDRYSNEDECGNGCCNMVCCCQGNDNKVNSERDDSRSRARNRSNSPNRNSPKNGRQLSPQRNEFNDHEKENDSTSKWGCCSCCRGTPKNQVKDRQNNTSIDEDPHKSDPKRTYMSYVYMRSEQPASTKDSRTNQPVVQSTSTVYSGYVTDPPENDHPDKEIVEMDFENKRQEEVERLERLKHDEIARKEKDRLEHEKKELHKEQERQREKERFKREQELKQIQNEKDRKLREEVALRKENEEKIKRDKAEQQQKYEDELKKQRDLAEKEREREFQIDQQRELARRKEQEIQNELKRETERMEREKAEQQRKYENEIKEQRALRKENEDELKIDKEEQQQKYEDELKQQRDLAEKEREREFQIQQQRELARQKEQEKENELKRETERMEKEKAEQQKKYENEIKKQRETSEREYEKEVEIQRQRDLYRRKEQDKIDERKQKLEEEKRKEEERQKLHQQQLARQLSEQNQPRQQQKYRLQTNKPAYLAETGDNFRENDMKNVHYNKDTESKKKKTDSDSPKLERPMKLVNSNDKYVKGLIDGDIGRKGTRNPNVYSPRKVQKPTKVTARGEESDNVRSIKDDVRHDDKPGREQPLKLINSNDKFMRGINNYSIGQKATNNPFVYRPYKIEKPKFDTQD